MLVERQVSYSWCKQKNGAIQEADKVGKNDVTFGTTLTPVQK
jgi:hypothetical protein